LQRELADLRTRRVQLRRILNKGVLGQSAGDALDNRLRFEQVARELRATQKRWEQLHYELGIAMPGPSVKLNAPPRARTRPATRTVPFFVTRMVNGPGCR
jgi:hypothetical protein